MCLLCACWIFAIEDFLQNAKYCSTLSTFPLKETHVLESDDHIFNISAERNMNFQGKCFNMAPHGCFFSAEACNMYATVSAKLVQLYQLCFFSKVIQHVEHVFARKTVYGHNKGAHPFICPNLLGISPRTTDFLFCFACFVHAIAFHEVSSVKSQSRASIARP